ncbi:MAG: hypothetical protein OEY64_06570 [Nitrospinota bacterium]|nr:hypothetical protein [Nitrospinota bacterium]
MRFGEFLISKNLVTEQQVNEALDIQRHSKLPLGKIAVMHGFISKVDNLKLLLEQNRTNKRYGDLAIEHNLLTNEQINEILVAQQAEMIPMGKALIEIKAISRLDSIMALVEYANTYATKNREGN